MDRVWVPGTVPGTQTARIWSWRLENRRLRWFWAQMDRVWALGTVPGTQTARIGRWMLENRRFMIVLTPDGPRLGPRHGAWDPNRTHLALDI